MTVTPQGNVYLCKTKLENDYKNQLTFSSASAQLTYFNSTIQQTFSDYTYVKKDNIIKVGANIDSIIGCNYLFYKNTGFTTKYYFCFITKMEYINENCTAISIETDCFQTWQFDITYNRCFVEREHVNDDTVGLHLVDEGLSINNYICEGQSSDPELLETGYIAIESTFDPSTNTDYPAITIYSGNVFGVEIFIVKNDVTDGWSNLARFIMACNDRGKPDAIKNIYQLPNTTIDDNDLTAVTFNVTTGPGSGLQGTVYKLGFTYSNKVFNSRHYDSTSMVVKNNKCKTYPYRFLQVTNNSGVVNKYKFEFFEKDENNQFQFAIQSALCVGGSVRAVPLDYKGYDHNYDESIPLGKFPNCGWTSDAYTNWLTQNALNQAIDIIPSMLGTATQAQNASYGYNQAQASGSSFNATGTAMNFAGNVAGTIGNLIKTENSAQFLVNKLAGTNMGDINFSAKTLRFEYYNMRMSDEDVKIIDDYFSMFGYKVNEVKIPNITGRINWNFVKTVDCNIDGDIPQEDLNILKTMFNNGVTMWHNPATMYHYENDNSIVS